MKNPTLQALVEGIRNGLFSDRPTIPEAYEYAVMIANASDNPPAVLTAVHVMLNTIANVIEQIDTPAENTSGIMTENELIQRLVDNVKKLSYENIASVYNDVLSLEGAKGKTILVEWEGAWEDDEPRFKEEQS